MTITAATILDSVRKTTLDGAARAYSNDELLMFLTEALRSTAGEKLDFYTKCEFVTLVAGELQQIPADGVGVLNVIRNSVANGGRVITQVQRDLLNEASRFWPAGTRQAQVEHFTTDPRDPLRYQVFPPNNGAGSVELLYGACPPEVTSVDQEMVVLDVYEGALVNYVLAKCYGVSSKKQDLAKFNGYMGQYRQTMGLKTKSQYALAPRVAENGDAQ